MLNIAIENESVKRTYVFVILLSLNYFSMTSFAIALKVSFSGRNNFSVHGKCPNFSMRLPL